MKKNIVYLLVGIFLSTALSSCDECDSEVSKLRIVSLTPLYVKITGTTVYSPDEYYDFTNYTIDSSGIRYDSLGIQIDNGLESFSSRFNFPLLNSAYACEPVFHFYGIDSMFIYSDQDYNNMFPAGTNLRSIVGFRNGNNVSENADTEIQGSLGFINFKTAPDFNKSHVLTIVYRLSNGNKVKSVLPKVKILKP